MAKSNHPLYKAIERHIFPYSLEGRQILANNLLIQYPSYFDGLKFYILDEIDMLHKMGFYSSPGDKAKKIFWKEAKKILSNNANLYLIDPRSEVRELGRIVSHYKDKA